MSECVKIREKSKIFLKSFIKKRRRKINASYKAREWQDRLRAFTEENELKRDYTREHIKEYKQKQITQEQYEDITDKLLSRGIQKYKVKEQKYFIDENKNKYVVDNKHVLLEPTQREKEVANMLGELYGGKINIVPRINEPEGIKTPDYIVKNKKYDLKQIKGNGKYVIEGNLRGKQKQADNFIIDITNSSLNKEDSTKQIQSIYKSKRYEWVDRIILIKDDKFIKIYKRK